MRVGPQPSVHPHSEVTAPTFCLYDGDDPQAIVLIHVMRRSKEDDERIDIMEWSSKTPWAATDQMAWKIEYAPDPEAEPSPRPFSCITYGKVPPGYIEKTPAAPLIPERLYTVLLDPKEVTARGGMYFIIRLDSAGHPTQLEYTIKPERLDHVRAITQQ